MSDSKRTRRSAQIIPGPGNWSGAYQSRLNLLIGTNQALQQEVDRLRRLARAVEQSDDTVIITNRAGIIEYVNEAFERKTGYSAAHAIGQKPNIVKSGVHDDAFYGRMWATLLRGDSYRGVFVNRCSDGRLFHEQKTITPLRDSNGRITHYAASGRDITEQVTAQARVHYLANHDALTGLANRTLLNDRLEHALTQAQRNQRMVAVMFLDLDNFKSVNDSLGHGAGDKLLAAVARRLRRNIRKSDSIARYGGDEFIIVLEDVHDIHEICVTAEKLLLSLSRPCRIGRQRLTTTTSIGIAVYPFDGMSVKSLVEKADQAMYRAKSRGGCSYTFDDRFITSKVLHKCNPQQGSAAPALAPEQQD